MMINKHGKAEIVEVESEKPIVFEVNFDEKYKDCVRINGLVFNYSDIFSFMFMVATPEQQSKMIPVREELGHQYMKQIHVRLKKDMKEGEEMVVNVPINVPQIIEDEILSEKKLSTGLVKTPYLTRDEDNV